MLEQIHIIGNQNSTDIHSKSRMVLFAFVLIKFFVSITIFNTCQCFSLILCNDLQCEKSIS